MKRRATKIVIIVGIVATIASPYLFTRNSFLCGLDFTGTGQIGDTIGGITSPIVGLMSIILLYITLCEQQKYNIQQKIDNRINHLLAVQNDLNSLNNNVFYKCIVDGQETQGNGLLQLIHLWHTNAEIRFLYRELKDLFGKCIIARIMCQQLKKLSSGLCDEYHALFYAMSNTYLYALSQFLGLIESKNIIGSIKDSCADDACESEIDSLVEKIKKEVGVLEGELKS